jgi:predicted RNA binding protein YcfA (HicA-like mRNA interferase family)
MAELPVDAPKERVIRSLTILGFRTVREGEHISMVRESSDGTRTPLTMPNHPSLKTPTLRVIRAQAGISREDFIRAYESSG